MKNFTKRFYSHYMAIRFHNFYSILLQNPHLQPTKPLSHPYRLDLDMVLIFGSHQWQGNVARGNMEGHHAYCILVFN